MTSPIGPLAPFGSKQARVVGIAYKLAWQTLITKCLIAEEHVEAARAQLGRRILQLAEQGETDPRRLARYAVAFMRM